MSRALIHCPHCQFQQAQSYSYCGHCGQALFHQCHQCHQYLPWHFRYCGYCGIPLTAQAAAPNLPPQALQTPPAVWPQSPPTTAPSQALRPPSAPAQEPFPTLQPLNPRPSRRQVFSVFQMPCHNRLWLASPNGARSRCSFAMSVVLPPCPKAWILKKSQILFNRCFNSAMPR